MLTSNLLGLQKLRLSFAVENSQLSVAHPAAHERPTIRGIELDSRLFEFFFPYPPTRKKSLLGVQDWKATSRWGDNAVAGNWMALVDVAYWAV